MTDEKDDEYLKGLKRDDLTLTLKDLKGQMIQLKLQMLVVQAGIAGIEVVLDHMPTDPDLEEGVDFD